MGKNGIQENFRYRTQDEKDLVNQAFQNHSGKVRQHFIRDIVLKVCKRLVKK
jgi:hypothetical protein